MERQSGPKEIVYCHLCYSHWYNDTYGIVCPHCENEATEIASEDNFLRLIEDSQTLEDNGFPQYSPVQQQSRDVRAHTEQPIEEQARLIVPDAGLVQDMRLTRQSTGPQEEVVVAVMGVTGSGKSTLIRTLTGREDIHVGHTLESATSEVNAYKFTHQSIRFCVVDTPGFNDTNCSDEEIMTRVLEWLETSFRSGTRLNGLIYLHRIIDPKMQGSALSNMRMFRRLCGPSCFQNIVLATTFWDDVNPELGAKRERQLQEKPEFWGAMTKKGSQLVRLGTDRDSCLAVLMEIAKKKKITLQSQHEMVMDNRSAHETAAAQAVNEEILRQKIEFDRELEGQRIKNEEKLEQRKIEKQLALDRERIAMEQVERERAALATRQKAEEEAAWRAEYDRKERILKEQQAEAQKERNRLEEMERKKEKILAAEQQRQADEQRRQADLRAQRQRHYNNYTCQRGSVTLIMCDKCLKRVQNSHYYHCCFCDSDNYDQCDSCGGCCPVTEHPYMKRLYQGSDDCIVM